MRAYNITPHTTLATLLTNQISVGTSGTLPVYDMLSKATASTPNDFVSLQMNGTFQAADISRMAWKGKIILSLYCRLNSDDTIKHNRIKSILAQLEPLIDSVSSGDYFFKLDLNQPIMPPSANYSIGYSVTKYNVEWHTK